MGTGAWQGAVGARINARRGLLATAVLASFYLMGFVGVAFLPLLAREAPTLLAFLNPTTGVLLLVSARIDPVPFVVIGTLRRFASHLLFFLLGAWYGDRAVRWVAGRGGRAVRFVRLVERLFARLGWLIVLVSPGPLPSVLAGAARMRRAVFVAFDLTGALIAILIVRCAAAVASDPLGVVLRFSDRHAVPLTALCAAATGLWLLLRWMRGRTLGATMTDVVRAPVPPEDQHARTLGMDGARRGTGE